MLEQDPTLRYSQLRAAAVAVLDAAAELPDYPESLRRCLVALHRAVQGEDSPDNSTPAVDPGRHMVSLLRYEDREKFPITLDQEAVEIRRDLEADQPLDERAQAPDGIVVLTELRGMVVGSLLRELAARLSPGAAFGPGRAGTALAEVATDLSWEILNQTIVGRNE